MVKMENCDVDADSLDILRNKIQESLTRRLVEGETWYLIDVKWFENLKIYLGLDDCEDGLEDGDGERSHPGLIDNSNILDDDGELCEHMVERENYVLVPEDVWELLKSTYGLVKGQKPLARQVVDVGQFTNGFPQVEVYLLELKIYHNFNSDDPVKHKISRKAKMSDLHEAARKIFDIPKDTKTELYTSMSEGAYELVKESSSATLLDEIICPNTKIILAVPEEDGGRPPKSQDMKRDAGASIPLTYRKGEIAPPSPSVQAGNTSMTTRYSATHSTVTPGLCGLSNLGNTCFMNSVLQCMSNTPPITDYFLTDRHRQDLNVENPLGMRGEIAKSFGELIKVMWSGTSHTSPHHFKQQVAKFAPQFSGYQQHDAQELLTFLLDGLHEDLNRIHDKPYITQRDSDGRPDEVVAAEAWSNYLKRNDSIIVELFHGLLKSTVWCPECKITSVTFDPLCYLSLPLPNKEKNLDVVFYPYSSKKPTQYKVLVPQKPRMSDVFQALHKLTDCPVEQMVATEIYKNHFQKIFDPTDSIDSFSEDRDLLHVYQIPVSIHDKKYIALPVCQWEFDSSREFTVNQLFGMPVIVVVPREGCTYARLFDAILERMGPYLNIRVTSNPGYNRYSMQYNGGSWMDVGDIDEESEDKPMSMEGQDSMDLSVKYSNATTETEMSEDWDRDDEERVHMNGGDSVNQNSSFRIFIVNGQKMRGLARPDMDTKVVTFPETLGRQYLVVQWTMATRHEYFKDSAVNDIEKHESVSGYANPNGVDLKDCLTLYTTLEQLDTSEAWYCPKCKDHIRATKKFDLWNLPQILVIHLKRFHYNRYRREKIDTIVNYPLRGLDLRKYVADPNYKKSTLYDLIGVCNHYGNLAGGHYTAYGLNKVENAWYYFDDNQVRKASESSVVSSSAYVLFYMRRDTEEAQQ